MNTTKNVFVNNTNMDKISQTIENGKKDKITLRKPVKLQGQWNLDPSIGYQFKTELNYEKGKQVIEIDSPSFLGGNGNSSCIAGITSCFLATFVSIAASKGIKLTKLNADTECMINFAKTFDIAEEPITEGINFQIEAQSDNADKQSSKS
jgi:uncharacterized OsmC-like protein